MLGFRRFLPTLALLLLAVPFCAQKPFPVVSQINPPTIAGRAVNLDSSGKLLPWPMADNTGFSYAGYFESQWTILWDQYNRQRLHYFYCCFDFDRTTYEMMPDPHWANSTGYLRAMSEGFLERYYAYSGDERTITFLESFFDYELDHGLTPDGYAWSLVPYASANPGDHRYTGWSNHGEDYIEPHVVGEDGYAYLRLYELTGEARYLREALRCADALVKNVIPGDESHSPWPVRLYARDGKAPGGPMGPYSANVIEPIMLFDELTRLGLGDVEGYKKTRALTWEWFKKYPLATNTWVGYFEDVSPSMGNMNQVIPLEFARYVLLHPELDPEWQTHAKLMIEWVKTTPKWPKYSVHGALITNEQGNGISFCCNEPNQCCDSHTSRLAAVEALYFAKTADASYRDAAFRSFNWVSYFQGLSGDAHAPFAGQWWFTDEFADGPRRMMDSFWAVPEWAPEGESHLLGSSSVIKHVRYGKGSVTYSAFDFFGDDVLRLDFKPGLITIDGKSITAKNDPATDSYSFDEKISVLRIHRSHGASVSILAAADDSNAHAPTNLITFDAPHLAAGTILSGQYPSGIIDWPANQWQIHTPTAAFGTFNLTLVDPKATKAEFNFYAPRIFDGFDVVNTGKTEATITFRSPELREIIINLKPGELKRVRSHWIDPSSKIQFTFTSGEGLLFDNFAWHAE